MRNSTASLGVSLLPYKLRLFMNRVSLKRELDKLLNEYVVLGKISSVHTQKKAAYILKSKIKRVTTRLNKVGFNISIRSWDNLLINDLDYFFNEYSSLESELKVLCDYEINIEFYFMSINGHTQACRIYDESKKEFLESFSYKKRLVFKESISKLTTWSYIDSLSDRYLVTKNAQPYTKHLYSKSRVKLKHSMYAETINPVIAEALVVEEGFGLIKSPNLAYFFARLNQTVGKLSGSCKPTDLIKVQVEKRLRPMRLVGNKKHKQGFYYVMHGYPISDGDLQQDTGALYNKVKSHILNYL